MRDIPSARLKLVGTALLLSLAAGGAWLHREQAELRREVAALREVMASRPTAPVAPAAPVESGHPPAADGSKFADEILALRGEVAALRRERTQAGPAPGTGGGQKGGAEKALPPQLRHGWLEAAGLPAGVLGVFQEQLGGVPFEGAHVKQSEGRFFYSTEAKLADGRHMELAVDGEGNVVRRSLEQPMEGLPPVVRQAVQNALGDSTDPHRINELFEDGRTVFRLTSKNPEQASIRVFSPAGQLLRSELIRREDRP